MPRRGFYQRVLRALTRHDVPCLIGGTYALEAYTGIRRATKDLDLFILEDDWSRVDGGPRLRRHRHRADVSTLARQGRTGAALRRSALRQRQRHLPCRQRVVRARAADAHVARAGAPLSTRGDDLVQVVRAGARALRRRRRTSPAARAGPGARLAASARPLRSALGSAAQPPGAVRVRLPRRARPCAGGGDESPAGSVTGAAPRRSARRCAAGRCCPASSTSWMSSTAGIATPGSIRTARCRQRICCHGRQKSPRPGGRVSRAGASSRTRLTEADRRVCAYNAATLYSKETCWWPHRSFSSPCSSRSLPRNNHRPTPAPSQARASTRETRAGGVDCGLRRPGNARRHASRAARRRQDAALHRDDGISADPQRARRDRGAHLLHRVHAGRRRPTRPSVR